MPSIFIMRLLKVVMVSLLIGVVKGEDMLSLLIMYQVTQVRQ